LPEDIATLLWFAVKDFVNKIKREVFIAISDDKTLRPENIKKKKKMVGNIKFKILLNVRAANFMLSEF
jgi:hypothetical protein